MLFSKKNQSIKILFFLIIFVISFFSISCKSKLANREIIKIDTDWFFTITDSVFDGSNPQLNDSTWQKIDLPHDWSIIDSVKKDNPSGEAGGYFGGGIGWYRKHFFFAPDYKDKCLYLSFDGAYMIYDVWVNGKKIGSQSNGYTSRWFDISSELKEGKGNVISVRINNSVQPFDRWYTGCGIYRHVWLTVTNKLHIPIWGTFITTPIVSPQKAIVNIKVKVVNDNIIDKAYSIKTDIIDPNGQVVASEIIYKSIPKLTESETVQNLTIEKPAFWSPDSVRLYKAVTQIIDNKTVTDEYTTPFGIRTLSFSKDSGFILNNRKVILKGVCLHHDLGSVGAAFYDKIMLRRLLILKEMGCNAIRLSHNPHAPQVLDMCDTLGILVFSEAFDRWEARVDRGASKAVSFKNSWKDDLSAFIERDRNHPSIFIWSVGNETYEQQSKNPHGIDIIKEMVALVHEKDPSRKVTSAMHPGFLKDPEQFEISKYNDVASYNYSTRMFTKWRKTDTSKVYLSSETKVYSDNGMFELGENPDFRGNSWFNLQKPDCGQFIWTGIDYLGESSGWPFRGFPWAPVNTCGNKKGYAYFTQSIYSSKPMVQIAVFDKQLSDSLIHYKCWSKIWSGPPFTSHWSFPLKNGDSVSVLTYTNCETVSLFLNNKLIGEKKLSDFPDKVIRWKVAYEPGIIKAVAKNNNIETASHQLVTAGPPEKVELSGNDNEISAINKEISIIDVKVTDPKGVICPYYSQNIQFSISGPANILAVDNGDLSQHFSFKDNNINANAGQCQIIIKANGTKGLIKLTAQSQYLKEGTIEIRTK